MKDRLTNDKFHFNQKAIKYLADIVSSSDLTEIEYKCGDISIKVAKKVEVIGTHQVSVAPVSAAVVSSASSVDVDKSYVLKKSDAVDASKIVVKAPVVGKIYFAEKPGSPALIKIGDTVAIGQKIFIIEAMKVMNNVKSTAAGVVKSILIQDGQAVEYGQSLVEIE